VLPRAASLHFLPESMACADIVAPPTETKTETGAGAKGIVSAPADDSVAATAVAASTLIDLACSESLSSSRSHSRNASPPVLRRADATFGLDTAAERKVDYSPPTPTRATPECSPPYADVPGCRPDAPQRPKYRGQKRSARAASGSASDSDENTTAAPQNKCARSLEDALDAAATTE
jgi:hypothetical protein